MLFPSSAARSAPSRRAASGPADATSAPLDGRQAAARLLAAFQSVMPPGWTWSVGGVGRHQLDAILLGIAVGGGVRVGLEDNIWADRGRTRRATNGEAVGRIVRLAELAERPIASPAQVRERLGLPTRSD